MSEGHIAASARLPGSVIWKGRIMTCWSVRGLRRSMGLVCVYTFYIILFIPHYSFPAIKILKTKTTLFFVGRISVEQMVMWIISLLLAYVRKAIQNLHGLSQGKKYLYE